MREWSGSEFLRLLCDQALLSRHERSLRAMLAEGTWPSEETRLAAMAADWWWLAPLSAAFVECVIEACSKTGQRVVVWPSFGDYDIDMKNLEYRTADRLPLFQGWHVNWSVHAAAHALCVSPKFAEPFVVVNGRNGRYLFSRGNGAMIVERYVPLVAEAALRLSA